MVDDDRDPRSSHVGFDLVSLLQGGSAACGAPWTRICGAPVTPNLFALALIFFTSHWSNTRWTYGFVRVVLGHQGSWGHALADVDPQRPLALRVSQHTAELDWLVLIRHDQIGTLGDKRRAALPNFLGVTCRVAGDDLVAEVLADGSDRGLESLTAGRLPVEMDVADGLVRRQGIGNGRTLSGGCSFRACGCSQLGGRDQAICTGLVGACRPDRRGGRGSWAITAARATSAPTATAAERALHRDRAENIRYLLVRNNWVACVTSSLVSSEAACSAYARRVIASSLIAGPANSPVCRPSRRTITRWQTRTSSAKSDEMKMTPFPRPAMSSISSKMLVLGVDVDALCWLVEDQDVLRVRQPLRENDLLLVAPAERRHALLGACRLDRKRVDEPACRLPFTLA